MDFNFNFQGNQIVCLEHKNSFLYAEVIQVIEARQTCWVRPWMLKKMSSDFDENRRIFDLRESSDLVLPISLFRVAMDTEVIPLLSELDLLETYEEDWIIACQELRKFVESIWEAYKPVFSKKTNS